ncbi:MAG: MarC family protein, partial [Pontibacter sp.]|nr:MarC family protein [Pontibacter sp.]
RGKKVSKGVIKEGQEKDDVSFTPLAMPMLSGPGAIAVSIGMFTPTLSYPHISLILSAIVLVAAVSFVILVFSHQLVSYLGKAGLSALSRIMGFIVLSIGVNFIMTELHALLTLAR